MNLFLDNIIFSLQKTGGISIVWQELLQRILNDAELNPYFLDFPSENIFRKSLKINDGRILNNPNSHYPIIIQRFLNPNLKEKKGVFHSSYYRIVKSKNIRNITTLHDFTYEHYRKGFAKFIHHQQKEFALKNSERIICVSHSTKSDLLKFYPQIDPTKVRVIYNGVNNIYKPLPKSDQSDLKKIINFSSKDFILYVGGRNNKYKNFNTSVSACHIAKIPLVLVGGGLLSDHEKSYLNEKLGPMRYMHLHEISNEQLNIIYNHAFCLLYPSISEGFGIPIIEAQRVGCPVISTNYSSIPEIAGKGAILLNEITEYHIADTLKEITRNPSLFTSLREEGFTNSQRFSWDKCYQQTKQVYREVYEEYF